MIDGITVLTQEDLLCYPDTTRTHTLYVIGALGIVIMFTCIGCIIASGAHFEYMSGDEIAALCFFAIGFIMLVVAMILYPEKIDSGRNRYKCTIEDDVSITEFYERYEVIEQDGNLWIIEDKESE